MKLFSIFIHSAKHMLRSRPRWIILISAFIVIFICIDVFSRQSDQSISWTFPYFSGAANFEKLFEWRISPSDFEVASQLNYHEYFDYRHQKTSQTISHGLNSYGYVLIALLSRLIFFWQGDAQGVISLQVAVHSTISVFFICFVFGDIKSQSLFAFLYAANPLIVYFAIFPFYYFWLCVPSILFALLLTKPLWARNLVLIAPGVFIISFCIRPTVIFLCILFYLFAFKLVKARIASIFMPSLALFVAGIVFISSVSPRMPPWHTIYIGVGAYTNDFDVLTLSDGEGFQFFYNQTGINISTDPISGNWGKPALMANYNSLLRKQYFQNLRSRPLVFFKNAIVNLGQVFSIGYLTDRPVISLLSSLLGWLFAFYLLIRRQWAWALGIFSSSLCFFWYFPPTPAYNFAAYLLIVCGFIASLSPSNKDLQKFRPSKR